ncbi:hypothetical protein PF004_g15203 [Phytophthora fragariae]|uniref:MULE transposase domain-containing protein n=1 Tax=Phytophthora fragariae TaxID=53985 RepID=A0A6G0NLZ1_9STRA|nr:hypothetical protein PF004_g15203 [Phytophthora fragariae]
MAREDSQLLMEDIKFFIIVKSQLVPCVVCALTRPHKMRYQLLRCSSETCKAATPYDACPWMGKVMTCQELNRVTIMEAGAHETLMRDPRKPKMTPRLKDYGREMATQGLKPARSRMGMARRFGLSETDLPTLNQVQWFIAAFTKAKLHRNDDYDDILGQIDALAYGPETNETQPFLFAWQRTAQGKPDVGNGSDEHPFLVGLTSKRLLRNAARDPASFVFHMDATFKLNQLSYPVIVCGVSDRNRSFHLVALFITSQRLEELYVKALSALRKVFTAVTGKQLLVKYVMADAEAAQQNAVDQVFGVDSDFLYLMCFYHVMAKVYERIKGVSQRLREQVTADIYDLHFAPTQATYDEQWTTVFANWSVEQFNRLIKRDYTLRTKHKIGTLFQLLADCCEHQSVTPRKFKDVPEVTQQLKARVNDFRQRNLLVDITPSRSSIEFLLVSPNPNLCNFKFALCIHVLFALQLKNYTGLDGKRTLVNRSVSKKRRRTPAVNARAAAGRPPTNGHALSTE